MSAVVSPAGALGRMACRFASEALGRVTRFGRGGTLQPYWKNPALQLGSRHSLTGPSGAVRCALIESRCKGTKVRPVHCPHLSAFVCVCPCLSAFLRTAEIVLDEFSLPGGEVVASRPVAGGLQLAVQFGAMEYPSPEVLDRRLRAAVGEVHEGEFFLCVEHKRVGFCVLC